MQPSSNGSLRDPVGPANPGLQLHLAQLLGQGAQGTAQGAAGSMRLGTLQAPGPGERGEAPAVHVGWLVGARPPPTAQAIGRGGRPGAGAPGCCPLP